MEMYIVCKLQNSWIALIVLVASIVFFVWAFVQDTSSSKYGILFVGFVWCSYLFLTILRNRKYVRTFEIEGDICHALLANGKEAQFSLKDIEDIIVRKYIGYEEIKLIMKDHFAVSFTNRVKHYDKLLKAMGYDTAKMQCSSSKDKITLFASLGFCLIITTLSILCAASRKGTIAAILSSAAVLGALFCLIILFIMKCKGNRS